MKVIIAGTRTFDRGDMVINSVAYFKKTYGEITEIVCGMAKGADMMGFNYANILNIPVKKFPPDWNLYGKSAGPIRNEQMAKYADGALIFWDGESKGTKNMIELARKHNLKLLVVGYTS